MRLSRIFACAAALAVLALTAPARADVLIAIDKSTSR